MMKECAKKELGNEEKEWMKRLHIKFKLQNKRKIK